MSPRRRDGAALGALALVVVGGVWAVPNVAGPAFVDVQLIATPVAGEPGAGQRLITLGDGPTMVAVAIRISISIEGRYPLPVVVPWTDPPLRVELQAQPDEGVGSTVWTLTGSAAELEGGADSPDGPAGRGLVLIRPGWIELAIGSSDGSRLVDDAGADLAVGRYVLQAWAFDIASATLPLEILD